jgi:predicted nucleic acid-binding protein
MIVIDASAVIELLLNNSSAARVAEKVFHQDVTLHAPCLLDVEVTHALRRYSLSGELTASRGEEAIRELLSLPIRRYPHDLLLDRAWQLRRNITAYDAMYIALAELLMAPLVTCDAHLARTRGHSASVEVL